MKTKTSAIFAIRDTRKNAVRQVVAATGNGRVAALEDQIIKKAYKSYLQKYQKCPYNLQKYLVLVPALNKVYFAYRVVGVPLLVFKNVIKKDNPQVIFS